MTVHSLDPPELVTVEPDRSKPARCSTERAVCSAWFCDGRPGTVVGGAQVNGGATGGEEAPGAPPPLEPVATPGEATAHPELATPAPPVRDTDHGRPPLLSTRTTWSPSVTVHPEASTCTALVMPNAAASRPTRAGVVVASSRYASAWFARLGNAPWIW
jgi:hypothetical protein